MGLRLRVVITLAGLAAAACCGPPSERAVADAGAADATADVAAEGPAGCLRSSGFAGPCRFEPVRTLKAGFGLGLVAALPGGDALVVVAHPVDPPAPARLLRLDLRGTADREVELPGFPRVVSLALGRASLLVVGADPSDATGDSISVAGVRWSDVAITRSLVIAGMRAGPAVNLAATGTKMGFAVWVTSGTRAAGSLASRMVALDDRLDRIGGPVSFESRVTVGQAAGGPEAPALLYTEDLGDVARLILSPITPQGTRSDKLVVAAGLPLVDYEVPARLAAGQGGFVVGWLGAFDQPMRIYRPEGACDLPPAPARRLAASGDLIAVTTGDGTNDVLRVFDGSFDSGALPPPEGGGVHALLAAPDGFMLIAGPPDAATVYAVRC